MRDPDRVCADQGAPFAADAYDLTGCRLLRLDAADPAIAPLATMLAADDPWRRLGLSGAALAGYLGRADAGLTRFRIVVDDTDQGVLCLRYPWLRGAYIELIGVAPGRRYAGTGSAVLTWMADEIAGRASNLWATVSAFNQRARRFYSRHGFDEVAPLADLVRPGEDEILLRKRIA
jgi:ribosomal protein S18 acetylase RimI-like enzyme